jgi:biopolymer transport protein ExbB
VIKKLCVIATCLILPLFAQANWNSDWENQKKISINAVGVTPTQTQFPVVVRLHSGNFDFSTANADGSDLRFIAADDKTELKFHIEKYDSVNELAVIWVQLPKVDAADKEAHFWVYSGNEKATASADAKLTWDTATVAAFHFAEKALLQDSSASALVAAGEVSVQKSALLGEAAVFNGKPLTIAAIPNLKGAAAYTWSAWVKPANITQASTLVSLGDTLSLKTEGVKLSLNGGKLSGGELKAATWQHVALIVDGAKASLYINGISVASGDVPVVDASTNIKVGDAFTGEIDEMQLANVARSPEWLKLSASAQGMDSQLLKIEESDDEEGGDGEPNYIAILISSLTIDAKVVIGILAIMFGISTWVMIKKAKLVSITDKDNALFLARFQNANNDLLSLDQGANYDNSTLYRLYKAGLREITKRQQPGQKLALTGAAMDAIKAAIDADLVRETQKQNAGMVLLTIAISGGPFLGLLGTVVGVMITFAAIAAAGDVNVNAIAPGIAAALLATVAGLAVAIPALFGYNYLASRIKNITIAMQIFVDEFVTRTAELYGKQ